MSYYHTNGVVRIQSYAEALHKLQNTKPINSKQSGGRIPLGHRKYHARASISRGADGYGICLNDYDHPLVVWSEDNTFVVHPPKYKSAFLTGDLSAFLPSGMRIGWNKGRYVIVIRKNHEDFEYFLDKPTKFQPCETDALYPKYEIADAPKAYHVRLRPNAYRSLLTPYGAFTEWLGLVESIDNAPMNDSTWSQSLDDALCKLRGGLGMPAEKQWWEDLYHHFTNAQQGAHRDTLWADYQMRNEMPRAKIRDGVTYHSGAVKLLLDWMADTTGENWVACRTLAQRHGGNYVWREHRFVATPKQVQDFIKDLVLHHHRDKVFALVETQEGEVPTTRNQEYFRSFRYSMEKPLAQG